MARLWERARRKQARAWLQSMARPHWAFTSGRSSEFTVWRQQTKATAMVDSNKDFVVGAALRDMMKLYESVDLEELRL